MTNQAAQQSAVPPAASVPAKVEKKPEVYRLGVDEVSVIRSKEGTVKLFKSSVTLKIDDGTLVQPSGMSTKVVLENGQEKYLPIFLVTSEGYKLQAEKAGLFTVNAPNVVVDGKTQPNPCVMRNAAGQVQQIYCRAITFGFSSLGVPVVSDRTAIFDLFLYKVTDLLAKAKWYPAAFKVLPSDAAKPGAQWAGYPLDEAVTLWADTSTKEFIEWQGQMVNRQRKAVEIAQTFAQRNAIKNHPSIRVHKTVGKPVTQVDLLCWRPTEGTMRWDMSQFQDTLKRLSDMAVGNTADSAVDGAPVQVVVGTDQVHEEAEVVDAEQQVAPDQDDVPPGAPDEAPVKTESPREQLVATIRQLSADIKDIEFVKMCKRVGIKIDEGEEWRKAGDARLIDLQKEVTTWIEKHMKKDS